MIIMYLKDLILQLKCIHLREDLQGLSLALRILQSWEGENRCKIIAYQRRFLPDQQMERFLQCQHKGIVLLLVLEELREVLAVVGVLKLILVKELLGIL